MNILGSSILLLCYAIPLYLFLSPRQYQLIWESTATAGFKLSDRTLSLWVFLSLSGALTSGFVIGCIVMFGPAYALGDRGLVALPWFTMLPALFAAIWTVNRSRRWITFRLIERARAAK